LRTPRLAPDKSTQYKAYDEYIRWQAFVVWARAILELEGSAPSWLEAILRKRCPGFMEEVARSNKPELLGLQLFPWVHNQVFAFAKEEGWLDALVFYGFRDTRSQGYWARVTPDSRSLPVTAVSHDSDL
jgi:hypothetical protein